MNGAESLESYRTFLVCQRLTLYAAICQSCYRSHFEVWFAFPKEREKRFHYFTRVWRANE